MIRSALILALLVPLGATYHPQYVPSAHFPTATVVNPCLLAAWPMNEGSGTTLNDVSGNSDTATIQSAPGVTWQSNAGFPGTTPFWNGSSNANTTNGSLLNFTGATPFSVSVWFSTTINGNQAFLGNLNAPFTFNGWELGTDAAHTKLNFYLINTTVSNAIEVQGSTTINTGSRIFAVVTYDGSKTAAGTKLYVNGTLETPTVVWNTLTATTANGIGPTIGARTNTSIPFTGAMAFAEVYNCVLTPTQISTYNAGGPGIY